MVENQRKHVFIVLSSTIGNTHHLIIIKHLQRYQDTEYPIQEPLKTLIPVL